MREIVRDQLTTVLNEYTDSTDRSMPLKQKPGFANESRETDET